MFAYTGEYFEHTSDSAMRSTYYTFTPKPLMEGGFYSMDEDLASLLITTHRMLGRLEGMTSNLEDSETLRELMLLKESCYSRQIDYNDCELCFILEKRSSDNDISAIDKITSAYKSSLEMKVNLSFADNIYRNAVHGFNSRESVRTRTEPMFLTNSVTNIRRYNPTAPKQINSASNDIVRFLDCNSADALIKAALTHYQFEMIHPYECYNGIVGRILIFKILHDAGLDSVHYLSLSEYLYHIRNDYFDKLSATQMSGGYILWIKFFVQIVYEAAMARIDQIKRYQEIVKLDGEKIANYKATDNTLAVHNYFKKHLISDIRRIRDSLHTSYNTVANSIKTLQKLGILAQTSNATRNRRFEHSELVNWFLSAK